MDGYRYLSMNYVLAPAGQNTVTDLTMQVMKGDQVMNTLNVPNVPMRANYQTNIYGSLLTNPEVFNVTINPAFEGTFTTEIKAETASDLASALQSPAAAVIEIPQSIDASSLT